MNTAPATSRPGPGPRREQPVPSRGTPAMRSAVASRPQGSDVRVRIRGVGSMAVGSVEAIGGHAVGFARGDRVVFPLSRNERGALGSAESGNGSESLVVDSERLIGVPRDVGDEQAARLLAPGLVARVLLRQLMPVHIGDRVRIELEPGTVRAVVAAWADALGADVGEAAGTPDVVLDEEALRQAHAVAFRRGRLQVGSAEVFAAIRDGVFDAVVRGSGAAGGARAAA